MFISGLNRSWIVLFGFFILSILLTWPLCIHLSTHLPMGNYDVWQNYWNFWWWKTALLQRHQSPYYTDLLFYPLGAPLGLHTNSEANILLTLPVNILFGIPAALNLAILAGFIFSAWGAYLLARHYVPGHAAPFLAGIVFAFAPQHAERSLEQINLASIQGIPLFLWALVALLRNSGWKFRILTGFFFAFNALLGWHNAALVLPLGIVVALFEMRKSGRSLKSLCVDLAASACISIFVLLPFLYPVVKDIWLDVTVFQKPFNDRSVDPMFFFIPHTGHPFWGQALRSIHLRFLDYWSVGATAYLGVVAVILAVVGFFLQITRTQPANEISKGALFLWVSLFLFYVWLSLGDTLAIANHEFSGIPMPFRWLKHIQVFGVVRLANRFLVPAIVSLSILTAIGAWTIANRLGSKARKPFFLVTGALLILDFLWIPYPMRKVEQPVWIPELQNLLQKVPIDRAILDLPSGSGVRSSKDMFLQTYHGRPITGGYISTRLRGFENTLDQVPALHSFFEPDKLDEAPPVADIKDMVRRLKIGVIVVHLDRAAPQVKLQRKELLNGHPNDIYRSRLFQMAKGIPTAKMNIIQQALGDTFGPPAYSMDHQVEIYLIP